MVEIEEWSKSDPKDYSIASLTTRMNNLEGEKYPGSGGNETKTATTQSFGKWNSGDAHGCSWLTKGRIVKGKENITRYRKTYWLCPHQEQDNLYDVIYMEHDPGDGQKSWKVKLIEKKAHMTNTGTDVSYVWSNSSSTDTSYRQHLKSSENFRLPWWRTSNFLRTSWTAWWLHTIRIFRYRGVTEHCKMV